MQVASWALGAALANKLLRRGSEGDGVVPAARVWQEAGSKGEKPLPPQNAAAVDSGPPFPLGPGEAGGCYGLFVFADTLSPHTPRSPDGACRRLWSGPHTSGSPPWPCHSIHDVPSASMFPVALPTGLMQRPASPRALGPELACGFCRCRSLGLNYSLCPRLLLLQG